jgi:hypothetical protein
MTSMMMPLSRLPAVISDFNSIPAFAGIATVLAVLLSCVPAAVSGHNIAVNLADACC